MLKILRDLLQKIISDIDCGNSNYEENDLIKLVDVLKEYTRKDVYLSKYQAYTYLNMSRATFDNKVREGLIPKGKKVAGFKELMWNKKDLMNLWK